MDIFLISVTHLDLVNRCGWSGFRALIFVLLSWFWTICWKWAVELGPVVKCIKVLSLAYEYSTRWRNWRWQGRYSWEDSVIRIEEENLNVKGIDQVQVGDFCLQSNSCGSASPAWLGGVLDYLWRKCCYIHLTIKPIYQVLRQLIVLHCLEWAGLNALSWPVPIGAGLAEILWPISIVING